MSNMLPNKADIKLITDDLKNALKQSIKSADEDFDVDEIVDSCLPETPICLTRDRKPYIRKEIIGLLRKGYSTPDVKKHLILKYGYSAQHAIKYIRAVKQYLNKQYEKYTENVAKSNVQTLLEMKEEAFDNGNNKLALEVIKELNKMTNVYTSDVNLNIGSTDFKIKIEE